MLHKIVFSAVGLLVVITGGVSPALAQISRAEARNLGLEIAWQSQVQLPRAGLGLMSANLWPHATEPRKYAVVKLDDYTIRVSAEKLDRDGNPIGIETAKEQARQQAARYLGKPDGFEVVEVSIPRVDLVMVSHDGMVQNFDAETGQMKWSVSCGPTHAPAFPAAVSSAGVSVVHGKRLYLLDWQSGRQLMAKKLRHATSNAVAVCNDLAFVSDFSGRLEAYALGREMRPWTYVMQGRAPGQPVSFDNQEFCAIASDDGFVYVFRGGEEPAVWLRYEVNSGISDSLSAGNSAFYVGTLAGNISKVSANERLGLIEWEHKTGQAISTKPLVVGERVFCATEAGMLFCLNDRDGVPIWNRSGASIEQPLAVVGNAVFCQTTKHQISAFSLDSGKLLGSTTSMALEKSILNQLDDRLYVLAKDGRLQCLRAIGSVLPTVVTPVEYEEEDAADAMPTPTTSQPESGSEMQPGGNPFGSDPGTTEPGADPFGGQDPFGGADPFGGSGGSGDAGSGGEAMDEDPFGSDPFGEGSGF